MAKNRSVDIRMHNEPLKLTSVLDYQPAPGGSIDSTGGRAAGRARSLPPGRYADAWYKRPSGYESMVDYRPMRTRPLYIAALFLVVMAISHALGTRTALDEVMATGMDPMFKRALGVLWVNGSVLPLMLAGVLAYAASSTPPLRGLVTMVIAVTLLQAVAAAVVAGIAFVGVWIIVVAAALMVFGLTRPRDPVDKTRGITSAGS